jgi:hypothetical protein
MIEVQLVNSVAPFCLCNRLSEVMKKDNTGKNTSSMFLLWKASFTAIQGRPIRIPIWQKRNMLTHTAGNFGKRRNFMNAVDTGWVTDEDPASVKENRKNKIFNRH